MKDSLCFLRAARRCEIAELRQLALTSALVGVIGELVHALQHERGLANLFLADHDGRFGPAWQAQMLTSDAQVTALRERFDALDVTAPGLGQGARLFSRIAWVLQGLDTLPRLRACIATRGWAPSRATTAYARLIAGLLAVVFEAADSAGDPGLSRQLVALFNLMQGKEYAGQERATGAAQFAAGCARADAQQHLLHLVEAQERCLQVARDFTGVPLQSHWVLVDDAPTLARIERLRRILCTAPDQGPLDPALGTDWFESCTRRIDALRTVELQTAAALRHQGDSRIDIARTELEALGHRDVVQSSAETEGMAFFEEGSDGSDWNSDATPADTDPAYGAPLTRSTVALLREQSRRLQAVSEELATARASLQERKHVERAKGLLMAHRGINEDEAHKLLRQMAMNQNRRIVDVADALLATADLLPVPRH